MWFLLNSIASRNSPGLSPGPPASCKHSNINIICCDSIILARPARGTAMIATLQRIRRSRKPQWSRVPSPPYPRDPQETLPRRAPRWPARRSTAIEEGDKHLKHCRLIRIGDATHDAGNLDERSSPSASNPALVASYPGVRTSNGGLD